LEEPPDLGAPDPAALSMDETHLAKAAPHGAIEILGHEGWDVSRQKRVEVERVLERNAFHS